MSFVVSIFANLEYLIFTPYRMFLPILTWLRFYWTRSMFTVVWPETLTSIPSLYLQHQYKLCSFRDLKYHYLIHAFPRILNRDYIWNDKNGHAQSRLPETYEYFDNRLPDIILQPMHVIQLSDGTPFDDRVEHEKFEGYSASFTSYTIVNVDNLDYVFNEKAKGLFYKEVLAALQRDCNQFAIEVDRFIEYTRYWSDNERYQVMKMIIKDKISNISTKTISSHPFIFTDFEKEQEAHWSKIAHFFDKEKPNVIVEPVPTQESVDFAQFVTEIRPPNNNNIEEKQVRARETVENLALQCEEFRLSHPKPVRTLSSLRKRIIEDEEEKE